MDQQRRCLTGMTGGVPLTVPQDPANPEPVHTYDAGTANDPQARPYLDVVSLFVNNNDGTLPAGLRVLNGGVLQFVLVPAGETRQVYDETPFGGVLSAPSGGQQILVQLEPGAGFSADAIVWGWFVRTQG